MLHVTHRITVITKPVTMLLDHSGAGRSLCIAGKGEGSLPEYGKPGHLDTRTHAAVAAWIEAHP
ncbi:MAG TPA: hypothetical protein VHF86_02930 [Xanthomonadaceae bacterium]|nr:hypothetical protein [Xanthomonadaceae bacterium]